MLVLYIDVAWQVRSNAKTMAAVMIFLVMLAVAHGNVFFMPSGPHELYGDWRTDTLIRMHGC